MNVLKIVRSGEWWDYKLPPLMAIGYATVSIGHKSLTHAFGWVIFLTFALMIGAVYVSLINDLTDMDEDRASGKINRMAAMKPINRSFAIVFCLACGLVAGHFLYPDKISIALYFLCWVSFSLYSIQPFRLKTRGLLGVFADACGSHFFPGCFIVASVSFFIDTPINWYWFAAVALWSLACGLRGIFWHQFHDRDNDILGGVNTYATHTTPQKFIPVERLIMLIELLFFSGVLVLIAQPIILLFLLFYIVSVYLRRKKFETKLCMILVPRVGYYIILMNEFYQVFFPIGLIVTAALIEPSAWIILAVHLLLFNKNLKYIVSSSIRALN